MTASPAQQAQAISEEDLAYEIAEDNRLRAIGIDPSADPIDIMTEVERRYQQYQRDEDDGDDEAGQ